MSTPTPGPWIADGYDLRQKHGRMIAYFGPHHTPADEYPMSCRLQDEANAQWVAAAPAELDRLLAENDEMRVQIEAHKGGSCQCADDEACAHVRRAERAEAALAEAKVERETVAEASLRSLEAYIDKLKQFAERAEKAEAECVEQARLLGMSGEREADLLGKLERAEADTARLDWLSVSDAWFDYPATGAFTPDTMRAAIDAAMKGTT